MKVFVSSTHDDLVEYREHVQIALLRCEKIYKGMEYFGASEHPTLEYCLEQITKSELVICLLGTRYGTKPPGSDRSYTHHEIEHAIAVNRPILAYILDDNQPVLQKYIDRDDDAKALEKLKDFIKSKFSPLSFTTPQDLAMKITNDLTGRSSKQETIARRYRECAYDAMAEWYDSWYETHWINDEPFHTIVAILRGYKDGARGNIANLKILDCACGTGNTYAAFKQRGYNVFGTDGSMEMLQCALQNCNEKKIGTEGIIAKPINWTDLDGYFEHFGEQSFDVIVNTANSFCHIPAKPEYMNRALSNFYRLLKPGGLLLIDTKKYIHDSRLHGDPRYMELLFAASERKWILRTERVEPREVPNIGMINFHTRIMHDTDPSLGDSIQRALIVVTIYGDNISSRTLIVPYYPLPADILEQKMRDAHFVTTIYPAKEEPTMINWKYDMVVGLKP